MNLTLQYDNPDTGGEYCAGKAVTFAGGFRPARVNIYPDGWAYWRGET